MGRLDESFADSICHNGTHKGMHSIFRDEDIS